jgi:hypothetical protein
MKCIVLFSDSMDILFVVIYLFVFSLSLGAQHESGGKDHFSSGLMD